jgi:acetyl-CoA C-acetyltransferase
MASDPRAPVLVGVGAVSQREADPARSLEPADLMAAALERAGDDAGSRDLLRGADAIYVPRGFWDYPDPGRLAAEKVGAKDARSVLVEIGVLQTSALGHAARAIQQGDAEVVLVTGGEAKHRQSVAQRAGGEATLTRQGDVSPDEVLRPAAEIMHPLEISLGLVMPVRQYAVMESALRHAQKQPLDAHRRHVGALYERMNRVACENPDAWSREPVTAEEIAFGSAKNRMLAFPYTKLHCSQWTVDQAAGLIFCSQERARQAGIPRDRWIHPRAVAESNHMVPLVERRELHRSPGFALAGARALEAAGLSLADLSQLELYSCFPVALRIQAQELGISEERTLTVTGGMTFAGGPLNNFVLQGAVRMAQVLRAAGSGHGLLDAVSGLLTKQGVSIWSTTAGNDGFHYDDVSREAARATATLPVAPEGEGAGRVAGYTVFYETGGAEPDRAAAYVDLADGRRTIAVSEDAAWMQEMQKRELCGEKVRVAGGVLHPD